MLGTYDLAGGKSIVNYDSLSPAANIRKYLTSGYASGSWNGNGLSSGVAAGSLGATARVWDIQRPQPCSVLGGGVFGGLAVDGTAVLVRYTYYGDANIDGTVDTIDFNNLAANFGASNKSWLQGDFNYDGTADTIDFNLLASNFGQTLTADSPAEPADRALVPEPTTLAMLLAIAAQTARRRRCAAALLINSHRFFLSGCRMLLRVSGGRMLPGNGGLLSVHIGLRICGNDFSLSG